MENFKVRENTPTAYKIKSGNTTIKHPDNKYDVVVGGKTVAKIPDCLGNPKGVAEGIVEVLNRDRRFILPI